MDRGRPVLRALRVPDHRNSAGFPWRNELLPEFLYTPCATNHPLYYVALLLYYVLIAPHDHPHPHPAWLIFFLCNVLVAIAGWSTSFLGVFWSLAVEEQFYLVWPLLARSFRTAVLLWLCVTSWLGSGVLRFWLSAHYHVSADALYVLTPTHLDGLAAGATLACLLRIVAQPATIRRWCVALVVAGGLGVAWTAVRWQGLLYEEWGPAYQGLTYIVLALLFAGCMGLSVTGPEYSHLNRLLSNGWLVRFGRYSYAIYVFHAWPDMFARWWGLHPSRWPPLLGSSLIGLSVYVLIQLMLALGAGLVSWHLLEKHCLRLKDRFQAIRPLSKTALVRAN